MKKPSYSGAPAALLAVALVLAALLVPQFARTAYPAGSVPTPTPLAICGTIGTFTPNSATATGLISINTVSGMPNYTIAAGATITNSLQGTVTGSSVCLVGALDASGNLTSFTLTPNVIANVTLCGNIAAYTAPSANGVGSVTVGSAILPVAQNTTFTGGTAITTGGNLCIQATLNGLGQVVAGVVTANNSGTASTGAPVALCGTVASYTAATSTTAGTLQFTLATVNVTYTVPANATINGSFTATAIATGQNICVSGIVTGSNTLSSITLTANTSTMLTECGAVGAFVAPTGTTPGSLALGSTVLSVSPNATFSGASLTSGAGLCLAITLNGLGQVASATASATTPTTTSTATTVVTPTITPTPNVPPPPPPSQATNTPTATSTAVPTATSTPVPTDTPTATATATTAPTTTPTPKRRPIAQFKYISVWYNVIRIGTVEHLVVQAGARSVQFIEVHVYFATGRRYDFTERTNRRGLWTKDFRIPPYTISAYSREAVVTFQLFKNHTTSRDYRFFYVVH